MKNSSLLALLLLLSGCASTASPAPTNAPNAPNFVAPGQEGDPVALSALRGRTVILFFYTRDDTPTDTRLITDLRDAYPALKSRGMIVVGVSTDSPETHRDFATRLRLPFTLVSDPNGSIGRAYGVPLNYGLYDRRTFVIGPDGNIESSYRSVVVPPSATRSAPVASLEG